MFGTKLFLGKNSLTFNILHISIECLQNQVSYLAISLMKAPKISSIYPKFEIITRLYLFYLGLSFFTRLALHLSFVNSELSFGAVIGSFAIGFLYDLVVGLLIILPLLLQTAFQNNFIYRRNIFPFVVAAYLAIICLILFSGLIPKDFSPVLYYGLIIYLFIRLIINIVLFVSSSSFRKSWRKAVITVSVAVIIFILILNAVSEWFFWNEFSSRYNFIAVDYLVYTSEVLGSIWQSYPLGWILFGILIITGGFVALFRRSIRESVSSHVSFFTRTIVAVAVMVTAFVSMLVLSENLRHFSTNEYANSLAGNGLFEFGFAFQQNELEFTKYYRSMPDTTAFSIVRQDMRGPHVSFVGDDLLSIERDITYPGDAKPYNVVMITIESLSAEYMHSFGNESNITPTLDSLANHSLFFTNLYASGTRTVRGLEALSLSIPPTPGQSIIKRPDNSNLFSLGSVLKEKGYTTQYLYGGYSYFDNMQSFFSQNGYTVMDRSLISEDKIHYQNIWGVADEDLFDLAIKTLDSNAVQQKPFFTQIMTVSNHRPYTYPDNRIDIPSSSQTRYGAVKYTDYAIGRFLQMAAKKSWFDKTVFVIISDHCAGSAGSVQLPVTGYHIPMFIYAPAFLKPQVISSLSAQIDVPPTILGLLNLDYRSKFFGQDLLDSTMVNHKAFISTYQGLGYLKDNDLIIQSPVRKINQYHPDFKTGKAEATALDHRVVNQAVAYYQCADWLLKHRKQSAR
jgi:phosphoglycerol transferase MdoB-like AlkP superfamily enzyme